MKQLSTKPPLVLIHGFRGSPLGLEAIATPLRDRGYTVYIPPIPPFAGAKITTSNNVKNVYTAGAYADYIANYIRENNLEQPILIGHSMGSIIAAAVAEKYPQIINSKLVLMSPISVKPAKFFAALTPLSALLPRGLVDSITTRYLFVPHDRALYRATINLTHACSDDQAPSAKAVFAAAQFSAANAVGDFDFKQQTLFLAGEHDRIVPKKKTVQLAEKHHAKTHFINGSGHLHNYEAPAATADAIIDFLENS